MMQGAQIRYSVITWRDGVGGGREVQKGGDICIPMSDSCSCMAETKHNIVKQLSSN